MATEKVTPMILKVDLQCPCCYKKIKKTLCKFPQIRDQLYDVEDNKVLINVVCCSPEKIRDKLCSKGGKSIKSITIVEKPEKKPDNLKSAMKPEKPKGDGTAEKPKAAGGAAPAAKPEPAKKAEMAAMTPATLQVMGPGPAVVHGVPSIFPYVGPSRDAYAAGPYGPGYGIGIPPPPPQPLYEGGYYGHGYGYGGGAARGHVNRSDNYFSEENPQTCSIM